MTGKRLLVHSVFVLVLPVIVAWYGISTAGAIALVLLALMWRWAVSVSGLLAPAAGPDIELETIALSHFAEKVRWSLDRLGVDYTENTAVGIFGVLFTGRTVPRLRFRTGAVRSEIGNSPEILRYLWGRYAVELADRAAFLEPNEERLDMEKRIDRYGANLQVWVYYHILDHKEVALRAWGQHLATVPQWQRLALPFLYPVFRVFLRRAFRLSDEHYVSVVGHIESLLSDIETRLDDGRRSILGGAESDFVDLCFAAISTLWLRPQEFAGGKAKAAQIGPADYPIQMGVDVERWSDQYPLTKAFVERLYREERMSV